MKRILFSALFLMGGYWLLLSGQEPEVSQEASVALPREASLHSPLPERRIQVAAPVAAAEDLSASEARRVADEHVEAMRDSWGIRPYHELHWDNTYANPLGSVVKYKVYQGDLPLVGMDIEIRVNSERKVADTQVRYTAVEEADLSQPGLSADEILESVSNRFEAVSGQGEGTPVLFIPTTAVASFGPELAIAMTVRRRDIQSEPVQAIFRARDGQILDLTVARAEFK